MRHVDHLEAVEEVESMTQKVAPKKKRKKEKKNASAYAGPMAAVGAALITKEQGADATSSVPREKKGFLRSRDVSVPPQSGQWAVVQGLQSAN